MATLGHLATKGAMKLSKYQDEIYKAAMSDLEARQKQLEEENNKKKLGTAGAVKLEPIEQQKDKREFLSRLKKIAIQGTDTTEFKKICQAAVAGNCVSQFEAGVLYEYQKEYESAAFYYQQAANNEKSEKAIYLDAKYRFICCYLKEQHPKKKYWEQNVLQYLDDVVMENHILPETGRGIGYLYNLKEIPAATNLFFAYFYLKKSLLAKDSRAEIHFLRCEKLLKKYDFDLSNIEITEPQKFLNEINVMIDEKNAKFKFEEFENFEDVKKYNETVALIVTDVFKNGPMEKAKALFHLARCYVSGVNVPGTVEQGQKLIQEGAALFKKSGKIGFAPAYHYLALLYAHEHIAHNFSSKQERLHYAFQLFKKAATTGYRDAQVNLAACYKCNLGVAENPENEKLAFDWCMKAALLDNKKAKALMAEYLKENPQSFLVNILNDVAQPRTDNVGIAVNPPRQAIMESSDSFEGNGVLGQAKPESKKELRFLQKKKIK